MLNCFPVLTITDSTPVTIAFGDLAGGRASAQGIVTVATAGAALFYGYSDPNASSGYSATKGARGVLSGSQSQVGSKTFRVNGFAAAAVQPGWRWYSGGNTMGADEGNIVLAREGNTLLMQNAWTQNLSAAFDLNFGFYPAPLTSANALEIPIGTTKEFSALNQSNVFQLPTTFLVASGQTATVRIGYSIK